MTKVKLFPAFLLVFILYSCSDNQISSDTIGSTEEVVSKNEIVEEPKYSCEQLPASFGSYNTALTQVHAATFPISENIDTYTSSWIRSARFRSCDGDSGFLIISTDQRDYIHLSVPMSLWEGFKNAQSYGSYYNRNLKGRYSL